MALSVFRVFCAWSFPSRWKLRDSSFTRLSHSRPLFCIYWFVICGVHALSFSPMGRRFLHRRAKLKFRYIAFGLPESAARPYYCCSGLLEEENVRLLKVTAVAQNLLKCEEMLLNGFLIASRF